MPLIPNIDAASVDRRKVEEYLLSDRHLQGRGKAKFFAQFGFRRISWHQLSNALMDQALTTEFSEVVDNAFGRKYIVEGPIDTPNGETPIVRSVWFIGTNDEIPVFVTAIPGRRREP